MCPRNGSNGDAVLLEVIACSRIDAIEAQRGGAGRLEIVRELGKGGLTPAVDLVRRILDAVAIPVRVMIREADGFEAGDERAVARLAAQAREIAALGVDGIVVGFLRGGRIDCTAMNAVLAAAAPVRATFHHAFDDLPDRIDVMRELARWPAIDRVLTAGGDGDWNRKAAALAALVRESTQGIGILAGGGVDARALRILARAGIAEAHVGRAAREPATHDGVVSARRVADLVEASRS